ncbi:hypothetical protein [Intestinimonas butyriciproducens]|uniref:hypothetical protein n=1 Tax=Intestinimonas butyriciproducens TaxID=1297617 RepID=UPI00195742E4|nr:hypothetical protein [Intestinimonas butyriciproducens]MBM6976695.1 hypothetical protein [Intestinimonas butyriciproducens]
MFLMDNLWKIFEVAREERTDGDAVNSDLSYAPALFLNALEGGDTFACLKDVDKSALLEQWKAEDQAAAKAEYRAVVGSDLDHLDARRYRELTAAFTAGDREAFEAAKESGLAELHAPEGVDEPTDGEEAQ